jgi:hypothetical protein
MNKISQKTQSQLFTIRMWEEELSEGSAEWRGRVQHVTSGAATFFRDWDSLIRFMQEVLAKPAEKS